MLACTKCAREMRCDKNGVGLDFGHGHIYPSDRFKCPECGHQVCRATHAVHEDEPHPGREYVEMKQGAVEERPVYKVWVQVECFDPETDLWDNANDPDEIIRTESLDHALQVQRALVDLFKQPEDRDE